MLHTVLAKARDLNGVRTSTSFMSQIIRVDGGRVQVAAALSTPEEGSTIVGSIPLSDCGSLLLLERPGEGPQLLQLRLIRLCCRRCLSRRSGRAVPSVPCVLMCACVSLYVCTPHAATKGGAGDAAS